MAVRVGDPLSALEASEVLEGVWRWLSAYDHKLFNQGTADALLLAREVRVQAESVRVVADHLAGVAERQRREEHAARLEGRERGAGVRSVAAADRVSS